MIRGSKQKIYLLDLEGNLLAVFPSLISVARYYETRQIPNRVLNSGAIYQGKYRIVTPEFFDNDQETIESWKKVSNIQKYIRDVKRANRTKYSVIKDNEEIVVDLKARLAPILGTSHQNIDALLNSKKFQKTKTVYHKKTGIIIKQL